MLKAANELCIVNPAVEVFVVWAATLSNDGALVLAEADVATLKFAGSNIPIISNTAEIIIARHQLV